jgi:hypothetical protein
VRTGRLSASITVTVSRSASRNPKRIRASSVGQSQTGEKAAVTFGATIGEGTSFSRSVTANAAAVPPSRP